MARLVTTVLVLALWLGPVTVFAQGDTPPQLQRIERFAAALSDGDVMGALALLTSDFVLEERDLGSRVALARERFRIARGSWSSLASVSGWSCCTCWTMVGKS